MSDNVNGKVGEGEAEQLQEWIRRWVPDPYGVLKDIDKFFPPGGEKGRLDPCSFYISYPRCFEKDLQEGWPMIESSLEKFGVGCTLKLKTHCIIFITKPTMEPDIIINVQTLLQLLAYRVPVPMALKVMDGKQWDIILTGFQGDGLCSKHGISKDQFLERQENLAASAQDLAEFTRCNIFVRNGVVVAMGSSFGLKVLRKMVEGCIVHKVRLAGQIKKYRMMREVVKKLDTLRFD
ncbi:hypothetical protein C1H46_021383 [Malus baccata]|uniref:KRR-R motif-containing protein 1 n=1 Tax=Malus baccata TaxID=106549 RepID=A0A540M2C9_MALBA|nr:hypothetical protein C1H46_021383 [Malus baccata]